MYDCRFWWNHWVDKIHFNHRAKRYSTLNGNCHNLLKFYQQIKSFLVLATFLLNNENAWALTYLPRSPNCTVLLPKINFFCNGLRDTQGRRSNGLAVKVLTHRQTNRKTAPILWPRPLMREVKMIWKVSLFMMDLLLFDISEGATHQSWFIMISGGFSDASQMLQSFRAWLPPLDQLIWACKEHGTLARCKHYWRPSMENNKRDRCPRSGSFLLI